MQNLQSRRLATLLVVCLIVLALASVPSVIPSAHATGTLYINPPSQPVSAPGSTVTYQVKVANIDPFNGWDIIVQTDPAAINPKNISITPNLLTANFSTTVFEFINCVNAGVGFPTGKPGNTGCTPLDGPGIAHSAAVALQAPPQPGPSSGLLFTANYTAVSSPYTAVTISTSSLSDGTPTPVPFTPVSGAYGTLQPDFSVDADSKFLDIPQGSSRSSTISLTSLNGFGGTVSLTTTVSPSITNGPTASFDKPNVVLPTGGTNSSALTVSTTHTTPIGNYNITVIGSSGSLTHFLLIFVRVQDFSITASPTKLVLVQESLRTSTINVTSINGFTGIVSLTATVSPFLANSPIASIGPRLALTGESLSGTLTLNVTATKDTLAGSYTVTVKGTSGSLSHYTTVTVNVLAFSISTSPAGLTILQGSSGNSTVTINSMNGYSGVVSLEATISPAGPTASLNSNSITLTAGGSGSSTLTVLTTSSTQIGTYIVTLTGTAGSLNHSVAIPVIVKPSIVVTNITISPPGPVTIGQRVTVTVTILNNGTATQDFTIRILWGDLTVAQQTETLSPGQPKSFPLYWDTSGRTPDNRPITAVVSSGSSLTGPSVALFAAAQPFLTSNQVLLAAGGSATAAIILLGLFLFLRRKKTPSPQASPTAPSGRQ